MNCKSVMTKTFIDEIEQYDRRQNIELKGITMTEGEDVIQITLNLAKKLDVDLERRYLNSSSSSSKTTFWQNQSKS